MFGKTVVTRGKLHPKSNNIIITANNKSHSHTTDSLVAGYDVLIAFVDVLKSNKFYMHESDGKNSCNWLQNRSK